MFFFLIRKQIYKQLYKDNFKDIYFDEKSFDSIPKWTWIFFINKSLFLDSQINNIESKNSSDDTKLLKNIIIKKKILKTSNLKIIYNTRLSLKESILHMFQRWPKFIDYYYRPNNKYFWIINFSLLLCIALILMIFMWYFKEIIISIIWLLLLVSLYFGKTIKWIIIVFCFFPIIYITFMGGWIKWLFLKLSWKL
jgi:hypothetical protein